MGTPAFAVPSLALLAEHHDIVGVVTQPDRPAGRGRRLLAPPVKRKAEELGLPVYQPQRIRQVEAYERLARDAPEVIAVVGYGQMIPKRIRDLAPYGCVNVHSSLLPKYRGAAPVNWAIVRGEARTGVTTMRISKAMDAGDIYLSSETPIRPGETASDLNRRLAPVGARLLLRTLAGLETGAVRPIPQDHQAATRAPLLRREDGLIDWSLPARSIHDRLRGFDPWPGVYTFFRGNRLRIWAARVRPDGGIAPGQLRVEDGQLVVGCGRGRLALDEVQLAGRKRVSAMDFARGFRVAGDEVLGNE
jgi:methionyl-tRNA formyltransferase